MGFLSWKWLISYRRKEEWKMRRCNGTEYEINYLINRKGNWNHKMDNETCLGKPICCIYNDNPDEHFVLTHKDLLTLIDGYVMADMMSIALIKNNESGDVKFYEESLISKIRNRLLWLEKIESFIQPNEDGL